MIDRLTVSKAADRSSTVSALIRPWSTIATIPLSLVHTGNNVEATFDFVERIVPLVAFDNVASTLLLVWTKLYGCSRQLPPWNGVDGTPNGWMEGDDGCLRGG